MSIRVSLWSVFGLLHGLEAIRHLLQEAEAVPCCAEIQPVTMRAPLGYTHFAWGLIPRHNLIMAEVLKFGYRQKVFVYVASLFQASTSQQGCDDNVLCFPSIFYPWEA